MISRPTPSGGPFHFPYRRIIVTGANGAGKTYLARRLADRLDVPLTHNDALALLSGWRYRPTAEVHAAQQAVVVQRAWVLEGGPSLIRPALLDHTDVVIWIDPPDLLRAWRVAARSARYLGRVRPELPSGNVEWPGARQLRFLWKAACTGTAVRARLETALADQPHVRLRSKAAVRAFLDAFQTAGEGAERL